MMKKLFNDTTRSTNLKEDHGCPPVTLEEIYFSPEY